MRMMPSASVSTSRLPTRRASAATASRARVEGDAAAEPPARPDAPEHHIRVGDRGLRSAETVRRRPRRRARAPGPNLESPVNLEPRDRAAAGAHGVHIDLRDLDGEGAHHAVRGHHRREVADQADVGGRPAHVVRDEIASPGDRAQVAGLADAAGGSGENSPDGQAPRRLGGHHAARRSDGEDAVRVAGRQQALFEPREVDVHQRLEVGVQDRGREALELAVLCHDVGRAGHGQAGALALRRVRDRVLVRRVDIRVEQADSHGLGARGERSVERAVHARHVERHQHRAVGVEPLRHLETALAVDDGFRPHEGRHEERGDIALGAADLDQVAKARGGEDGDGSAAPLEHRVGAHGGPVDHAPNVAALDTERAEAGEDRRGLAAPLRRHLGHHDATGRLVDRGEIGEGAAHVDADQEHGGHHNRGVSHGRCVASHRRYVPSHRRYVPSHRRYVQWYRMCPPKGGRPWRRRPEPDPPAKPSCWSTPSGACPAACWAPPATRTRLPSSSSTARARRSTT